MEKPPKRKSSHSNGSGFTVLESPARGLQRGQERDRVSDNSSASVGNFVVWGGRNLFFFFFFPFFFSKLWISLICIKQASLPVSHYKS